jgi:hypothetical protein
VSIRVSDIDVIPALNGWLGIFMTLYIALVAVSQNDATTQRRVGVPVATLLFAIATAVRHLLLSYDTCFDMPFILFSN